MAITQAKFWGDIYSQNSHKLIFNHFVRIRDRKIYLTNGSRDIRGFGEMVFFGSLESLPGRGIGRGTTGDLDHANSDHN